MAVEGYEGSPISVFVNCPFDREYLPLLRPLLFTLVDLGFMPRIASERSDAGENRIDKICELIRESRYSIHDLSRLRATEAGQFSRMNMPFELGIEYGCRVFGTPEFRGKRSLILEKDQHEFRKAISDLSGVDIKNHNNSPADLIRAVRAWFVETVGLRGLASATELWSRFTSFRIDFYTTRVEAGFSDEDLETMPIPEYIDSIQAWVWESKRITG